MPVEMRALRVCYVPELRREFYAGDRFAVASAADAKRLVRRSRAEIIETVAAPRDVPAVVVKEEEPEPAPLSDIGHYLRRDMRADSGQTGETTSLPSSRRGRPRKAQTSED